MKKYTYEQNGLTMRETKWGILLSANAVVLELIDLLNEKAKYLGSVFGRTVFIGQGLNLTKDHIVEKITVKRFPFIRPALVPFVTNEDHAQFELTSTERFIVNKAKLSSSEQNLLISNGVKLFDPDSTRKVPPVLILPRGIGRHYCTLNRINAFSASAVDIYDYSNNMKEEDKLNLWIYLNSSVCWLLREVSGRKNLGGGMLKAEATDLKKFPLYMNFQRQNLVLSIYNQLIKRSAMPILEEIQTIEHQQIDNLVFNYLGISNELRKNIITELVTQVENRQGKSRT